MLHVHEYQRQLIPFFFLLQLITRDNRLIPFCFITINLQHLIRKFRLFNTEYIFEFQILIYGSFSKSDQQILQRIYTIQCPENFTNRIRISDLSITLVQRALSRFNETGNSNHLPTVYRGTIN